MYNGLKEVVKKLTEVIQSMGYLDANIIEDLCEGQSLSKHQENVLFKKCLYCLSVDY